MATPWLEKAEGFISCPQEDTHARLTPEVLKKQTKVVSREQSEGHTSTPYEDTPTTSEGTNFRVREFAAFVSPPSHYASLSVSWSLPLVTLSVAPSIFSLPTNNPNSHTQHNLRHDPFPITPSRFASANRFDVLSDIEVSTPAPVEPPNSSPSPTQALSSTSAPPLIADTGCTGLLLQFSNYPALSPFFTPKPLPVVPFTLPDRSVLLVGGPSHLTGELSFPHKASPVSAYFLPDSALSHSLLGISPLIRPHGVAIFTPTSVKIYDNTDSPIPFLSGTKSPNSDLWFFSAPQPHNLPSPPTALFSLSSLPLARFVAYHHRAFGSPPISTFLRALSRGYIHGIPKLTATLVRKFPPLSLATSYGHLDTLRQGVNSTRRSPPSTCLNLFPPLPPGVNPPASDPPPPSPLRLLTRYRSGAAPSPFTRTNGPPLTLQVAFPSVLFTDSSMFWL